ncbi:M60 family metallopeptidase [Niabella aurantiaca]|uniref:M60 family metallopeptidase n=1 Tax=Niabella aurantiaca TaxID=379900 RepID=UPI00035F3C32|nr:M60 family metallopeptidase [Niabella aurantiaca]
MNSIYKMKYWLWALLIFSAVACKRNYGYNVADGFDEGQPSANAAGGGTGDMGDDFSKLDRAKIFPGLIAATEPRVTIPVTINMAYKYVRNADIKLISTPQPVFSTGLYAPAGEAISIEVPAGVSGLTVQIGGWTDNITNTTIKGRDPVLYNQVQLIPGINYVRNLYGGSIYIRKAVNLDLDQVTLSFSGVAKSPDFILGQTSDAEWNDQVKQSTVPWIQLRGKKIIFELPKYLVDKYPIANPTAVMQEWDDFMDKDVYRWKGLDYETTDSLNKAPELPVRVIMDVQPSNAYAHGGYPVVIPIDENIYLNEIVNIGTGQKGAWWTMGAIGSNNIGSSSTGWFPAALPNIHQLYGFKFANRKNFNIQRVNPSVADGVANAMYYVRQSLASQLPIDFSRRIPNFSNSFIVRLVPFLQLFHEYGYGLYDSLDYKARYYYKQVMTDQEKINFIYQVASDYAQQDLYMFFYVWGLLPTDASRDSIRVKNYQLMPNDVYNYNPVLDTGGKRAAMPEDKRVPRVGWTIAGLCCQEVSTGSYANLALDGDDHTYWHSQYIDYEANQYHLPHYMVFDMNKYYDISGFYYVNGHTWRPKTIAISFSADNLEWSEPKVFTGKNNVYVFNNYALDTVYKGVRYVRFEMLDVINASTNHACSLSEFGVIKP